MIKKHKAKVLATLDLPDIAPIVSLYSDFRNPQKALLECEKRNSESYEESYRADAGRYQEDADNSRERADSQHESTLNIEASIAALPAIPPVEESTIDAEIAKLAAFPWIAGVCLTNEYASDTFLKVTTRPNSLFTKMIHKLDEETRNIVEVPVYTIALPAYDILLSLKSFSTLSNNSYGLVIKLADRADYTHFLDRGWCSQEVHAHWGSTHTRDCSKICLGEYEGEVTQAFMKSLSGGFASLAEYLQTAGANNAYVGGERGKIKWALYMGKREYNEACIITIKSKEETATAEKELKAIGLRTKKV